MELSSFSENIVTVPYERNGERVELSVNIDAFTPEFFRVTGKRLDGKLKVLQAEDKVRGKKKVDRIQFFEAEARALEINRDIYAELLSSGVLTAWTVTENEIPIPPSKEVLLSLPPRLVQELWELCLEAAKTVKKRGDAETEETLENTHSGSKALRVVGQNT